MTDMAPHCYQCQEPLEVWPPYFCSDKCKDAYWHESGATKETKLSRSIPEIQRLMLEKSKTTPHRDDPADFMAHIVAQPAQAGGMPYRE